MKALATKARLTGCLAAALMLGSAFCHAQTSPDTSSRHGNDFYTQRNLVSDGSVSADHTDPNLINAWGVAFNPFGVVWVANNGTGTSTLYDGNGNVQSLVVQIPSPDAASGGTPTGIVFNASSSAASFAVSAGGASGPSKFLFATEDGVIAGWAPNVNPTQAIIAVDNSASTRAVYKGIALSAGGTGQLLYATDFRNARVDVFDSTFAPVTLPAGAFTDPHLPTGYAPFGIQAIGGDVFVTYAKQVAGSDDEAHGPGLGVVDVYDPNGVLLDRIATHGGLNAPWGIALAPAGFGPFSGSLLVGNFGDGRINAYSPTSHRWLGQLRGQNGRTIQIDGLWGLAFGNGFANQPVNALFYAAGPGDEAHGLYGRIDAPAGARNHDD
jgi:uncharacterized protein (TIGR03118 family)